MKRTGPMDKIKVEITHEIGDEPEFTEEQIKQFSERINSVLYDMKDDIICNDGYVEVQETTSYNTKFIAFCDDLSLRNKMQLRISGVKKILM